MNNEIPQLQKQTIMTQESKIMKTGIELIAEEREKQITKLGYDAMHDESHSVEQLVNAAKAYLMPDYVTDTKDRYDYNDYDDEGIDEIERNNITYPVYWPFQPEEWHGTDDPLIKQLIKGGAMIAAAIDRLQNEKVK